LVLIGLALQSSAEENDKPKYTIKEVMQKAHKGGLLEKVVKGEASADEKKELVELYVALGKNTSPRGEDKELDERTAAMLRKDWDEITAAMIKAAKDVVAGKEGAARELKKAVRCKNCHEAAKK
jgi:hypothetical protein